VFDVQGSTNVAGGRKPGATDRDGDYYQFKAEIESKEQIRDVVGDVPAKVITQLERWWDKYKVSLHELDAQVADAEAVMKGFLSELGYE